MLFSNKTLIQVNINIILIRHPPPLFNTTLYYPLKRKRPQGTSLQLERKKSKNIYPKDLSSLPLFKNRTRS